MDVPAETQAWRRGILRVGMIHSLKCMKLDLMNLCDFESDLVCIACFQKLLVRIGRASNKVDVCIGPGLSSCGQVLTEGRGRIFCIISMMYECAMHFA